MLRPAGKAWLLAALLQGILPLCPADGMAGTYFEEAEELLQQGREPDARRALELEIRAHPRNLEARYDLAILLERIGHDREAEALYRNNLKRGRHLPSVVNLAALLARSDSPGKAEALLKEATATYRAEAVPWYLLGETAGQAGNLTAADRYFRKAIEADANNGFAYLRYARFLAATGRTERAEGEASRAVELLPDCAPCLKLAGNIHAQAGSPRTALALWQRSIAIAPDLSLRRKIIQAMNASADPHP